MSPVSQIEALTQLKNESTRHELEMIFRNAKTSCGISLVNLFYQCLTTKVPHDGPKYVADPQLVANGARGFGCVVTYLGFRGEGVGGSNKVAKSIAGHQLCRYLAAHISSVPEVDEPRPRSSSSPEFPEIPISRMAKLKKTFHLLEDLESEYCVQDVQHAKRLVQAVISDEVEFDLAQTELARSAAKLTIVAYQRGSLSEMQKRELSDTISVGTAPPVWNSSVVDEVIQRDSIFNFSPQVVENTPSDSGLANRSEGSLVRPPTRMGSRTAGQLLFGLFVISLIGNVEGSLFCKEQHYKDCLHTVTRTFDAIDQCMTHLSTGEKARINLMPSVTEMGHYRQLYKSHHNIDGTFGLLVGLVISLVANIFFISKYWIGACIEQTSMQNRRAESYLSTLRRTSTPSSTDITKSMILKP